MNVTKFLREFPATKTPVRAAGAMTWATVAGLGIYDKGRKDGRKEGKK